MTIQQQYDDIANLYDILSEGDDGILFFRMKMEKLLINIPPGSKVLDCACGTGAHAIWMAKQGYEVTATDISEGMIQQAKQKAQDEGVKINFFRSAWEELSEKSDDQFALIINPGNSFSHVSDLEMLDRSVKAIKDILVPGGQFLFDLRDWEKTLEKDNMQPQEFDLETETSSLLVLYTWEINGWNTMCKMFVDIGVGEEDEFEHYVFDFFTIGYQQIQESLLKAGFSKVEREYYPDNDYYCATAE